MRNKTKFGIIFGALILVGVLLISAFSKINNLQARRNLTFNDYSVGAISTTTGKAIESKQSFFTEKMYSVDDLEIKVKEDATVSYKVFFYNADKEFISATTDSTTDFLSTSLAEGAKYFRIMITPAQVDGEAVECKLLNQKKYISQLVVTISK